ncbi:lysophospholipid acyltransferase family protein [bacterium]|nr:lysophospholipid acyltransferase family protein [bacterium]
MALKRLRRFFSPIFSKIFRHELKRARELLPEEFSPRKDEVIKGMAENQISNLLEIFLYEKIMRVQPSFVEILGIEHLKNAVSMNRGVIILSAHFGNWELIAYTLVKLGFPIYAIVRPQAVNRMTEFMNSFRERRGVKVLMAENLKLSLKILRGGGLVGIVSDLNAREWGYQASFFGRKASFYPTPVILSERSRAPVIPAFIERQRSGVQIVRFEPPILWKSDGTMVEKIQQYVSRYENAIRKRPDHWVWFHERYVHAELGRSE